MNTRQRLNDDRKIELAERILDLGGYTNDIAEKIAKEFKVSLSTVYRINQNLVLTKKEPKLLTKDQKKYMILFGENFTEFNIKNFAKSNDMSVKEVKQTFNKYHDILKTFTNSTNKKIYKQYVSLSQDDQFKVASEVDSLGGISTKVVETLSKKYNISVMSVRRYHQRMKQSKLQTAVNLAKVSKNDNTKQKQSKNVEVRNPFLELKVMVLKDIINWYSDGKLTKKSVDDIESKYGMNHILASDIMNQCVSEIGITIQ